MANIWKQNKDVNNRVKRNNFDLSFQNHLTMKMGTLYPVFCKEVVPGDSFRIKSAFGLKFMPLAFPVQSKMRAHMHFFYVRNKNLWNRWEDWLEGLKGHADGVDHPYISQSADFFRTGKLADYLGIPTTLAVSGDIVHRLHSYSSKIVRSDSNGLFDPFYGQGYNSHAQDVVNVSGFPAAAFFNVSSDIMSEYNNFEQFQVSDLSGSYVLGSLFGWTNARLSSDNLHVSIPCNGGGFTATAIGFNIFTRKAGVTSWSDWWCRSHSVLNCTYSNNLLEFALDSSIVEQWNDFIGQGLECAAFIWSSPIYLSDMDKHPFYSDFYFFDYLIASFVSTALRDQDYQTPFDSTNDAIHVSAMPFRAYESCYRAYFANSVLQPLMIDGQPEYNKFNTTTEGGADETPYELKQRNYELDFLTSALPSPQMGNAPLVGMTALGTITLTDPETGEVTTAKAQINDDDQIVGLNVTSPIANREHALTLAQIASAGFSINDFRNTNALQHFLETTLRKGYRYLDFIEGHHNVRPEYRELDMPEYIGGFSRPVTVSQIVSSSDTLGINGENSGTQLGSYNGMANCFGESQHSISHYCDDYGFIIGIMCVVPTPAYSQLLPKHYLKNSPLDYFFNEFSQIGMQPISYEEVCPVQAYNQSLIDGGLTSIHDTFGYQRPNYDMVASVDEIHGQFRGDLASFLINRVFESRPQLGDDFLTIDSNETNQIFIDQAPDSDNIIGQVVFDVKAKRPLPRVHLPSLGR